MRPCKRVFGISGFHIERMHEVKVGAILDAFEQWIGSEGLDLVPSDVRNTQVRLFEFLYLSRYEVQPFMAAELFAFAEQEFQTQAKSQQRCPLLDSLSDRSLQVRSFQVQHGIAECSDTRKDQTLRFPDNLAISADDRSSSHSLEGLLHAPEISHPVIDDHRRIHFPRLRLATESRRHRVCSLCLRDSVAKD